MSQSLKLFFTAILPLIAFQAHAYRYLGGGSRLEGWADSTLQFHLNPRECPRELGLPGLIRAAMTVWNSVPGSRIRLQLGEATQASWERLRSMGQTQDPIIVCSSQFGELTRKNPETTPGQGLAWSLGNRIVGGGLILNVQPGARDHISKLGAGPLTVVIAHEMGHVLGLGHSDDQRALMFWSLTSKDNPFLAQDDIDGFLSMYGR